MYLIPTLIISFLILIVVKTRKPSPTRSITKYIPTGNNPKSSKAIHSINLPTSWTMLFWIKYLVSTDKKTTIIKINNTPFAVFYPKTRTLKFKLYTNSGKFKTKSNLIPIQSGPYSTYKHFAIVQENSNLTIYEDTIPYIKNDPHQDMTINSTTNQLNVHFIRGLNSISFYNMQTYNFPMTRNNIIKLYETEYQILNQTICKIKKNKNPEHDLMLAVKRGDPFNTNSELTIIQ